MLRGKILREFLKESRVSGTRSLLVCGSEERCLSAWSLLTLVMRGGGIVAPVGYVAQSAPRRIIFANGSELRVRSVESISDAMNFAGTPYGAIYISDVIPGDARRWITTRARRSDGRTPWFHACSDAPVPVEKYISLREGESKDLSAASSDRDVFLVALAESLVEGNFDSDEFHGRLARYDKQVSDSKKGERRCEVRGCSACG